MQIKLTITVEPVDDDTYTEIELREAICKQFQTGGEIWATMDDGTEIAFITQNAE